MGEHRRGPPFRPPWWPENEPFPPRGPGPWQGMRRHFLRRIAVSFVIFFILVFAASAVAVALLSGALGLGDSSALVVLVAILGLLLVFGGLIAVIRVLQRTAAPIGDVMAAAGRVAAGDYAVAVEERGPREVRRLARSFNSMAERLRDNDEQRRNLLADIAHEMRTPLSVIQGNTEGVLDGIYPADRAHLAPVLEETRVMARLLDDLQTLSTAEAGALRLYRETVRPEQLVSDAAAAMQMRAGSTGLDLETRVEGDLPTLDVDPVRLGEVFANLISNAIRHTPPGGSVVVSAAASDEGREVAFSVQDSGPGIPDEVLPHVFERFAKAADTGGAGLGLTIARSLVEAHSGRITASNRPGGGTVITFVLPARDPRFAE
jgi:signal transduction histidine kinase